MLLRRRLRQPELPLLKLLLELELLLLREILLRLLLLLLPELLLLLWQLLPHLTRFAVSRRGCAVAALRDFHRIYAAASFGAQLGAFFGWYAAAEL